MGQRLQNQYCHIGTKDKTVTRSGVSLLLDPKKMQTKYLTLIQGESIGTVGTIRQGWIRSVSRYSENLHLGSQGSDFLDPDKMILGGSLPHVVRMWNNGGGPVDRTCRNGTKDLSTCETCSRTSYFFVATRHWSSSKETTTEVWLYF